MMLNLVLLFLVFAKIGAVVFGGGYVMIPLIQQEVVTNHHWLTPDQFTTAIALGQVTPGPILISATFVGYKVQGIPGAIVATIAGFLPSFLLTAIGAGQIIRFRKNVYVAGFIKGVLPAVVAMLVLAAITIGESVFTQLHIRQGLPIAMIIRLVPLAALAFILLVRYKVDAVYVVIGSGLAGFLIMR